MCPRRATTRVVVRIEVDSHAAHCPVVIRIETVRWVGRLAPILTVLPFVVKSPVGIHHAVEGWVSCLGKHAGRKRVAKADVMLGRDLPVGTGRDAHPLIYARAVKLILLPPKRIQARQLRDAAILYVLASTVKDGAKDIPATLAPVHIHLLAEVGRLALIPTGSCVEPEAIACAPHRVDADHGLHRGVVACTRIANDLHVADVGRVQLIQLREIAHLTAVDVDLGLTLSKDGENALVIGRQRGQPTKHIIRRTSLTQHRALHRRHERIALQSDSRSLSPYRHLAQLHGFGIQRDGHA